MSKENYSPWDIRVMNFPISGSEREQFKFLLSFAILAPSAHNTQPWQCRITDNQIEISINQDRNLVYGDTEGRELSLGLGCFLGNLQIAAEYFGFHYAEKLDPEKGPVSKISVRLEKNKELKNDPNDLIHAIPKRHSNRYPYDKRVIPKNIIQQLTRLGDEKTQLSFISEKIAKNEIAKIVIDAQVQAMEDVNFRGELSHYLKSSFTKEKYGMPGFAVGMPAILSLIAPKLVKKVNISKLGAKKDLEMWGQHTPSIGIISLQEANAQSWFHAGKIFERIWLTATAHGLAFSVWAAAIENKESSPKIQRLLETPSYPTVIFRIGFPIKHPKPSPRFSLKEILVH